jgi:predicted acylesterase/phospholipase RssA
MRGAKCECVKLYFDMTSGDPGFGLVSVVYAMSAYNMNSSLPRAFRTYSAHATGLSNCTIWEALRASTTHPQLFKEFTAGSRGERERFVYGGLGCSNPTARLLEEAKVVFPDRKVASIVSIGSGHAQTIQIEEGRSRRGLFGEPVMERVLRATCEMAVDNERVAEEMARRFADLEFGYYRLNVEQGTQGIDAKEWEKMSEVAAHTQAYLERVETKAKLDKLVDAIQLRIAMLETNQIGELGCRNVRMC